MKNRKTRLSLLIVALALTAQLSFISPSIQARNANLSTTSDTMMQRNDQGIPASRCSRRCGMAYRRCLRSGRNARACRMMYRKCLRRCPQ
jgi:hypothetical protein